MKILGIIIIAWGFSRLTMREHRKSAEVYEIDISGHIYLYYEGGGIIHAEHCNTDTFRLPDKILLP